jgi:single-strand DNA-binding protein
VSSCLNEVTLIGYVGQDAEIKETNGGAKYANFSMATSKSWKDDNQEWQTKTTWHRLVAWGKLADIAEGKIQKGKYVCIKGEIEQRSWETDSGEKRYATSIKCHRILSLDRKPQADSDGPGVDADDEIPF